MASNSVEGSDDSQDQPKDNVSSSGERSEVETELMLKSHQSDTSRLRKSTVAKSDRRIEKEQIEEIVQHFHSFSK